MSPASNKTLILLAASALAVLTAGCSNDALDRRDKVALTSGNAPASNNAIHTDDPWPSNVNNTDIPGSGQRGENVMKKYNKGPETGPPPVSGGDTGATVVMPPPASPPQ